MNLSKKMTTNITLTLITMSSLSYATMTCSCSSGSMTVVHDGDTVSYSCADGGRITCMIK